MSISSTRRRWFQAAAFGLIISVSPIVVISGPAAAAPSSPAVSGLERGARGDAVKSVQQALVSRGVQVAGGVDGIFGPGTEAALKTFQKQAGLTDSGKVDDATALALGLASSDLLNLSQGKRSDDVRELQQALIDRGITVRGGADGIFGPGTEAALKAFQKQAGLQQTGKVDAATAAALGDVSAPKAAEPQPAAPAASENGSQQAPAASGSLVGLKIGSRGEAVKQVQSTIMSVGFTVVGGADGIFGALTANAVKSFQNANGLAVTGAVDEATAALLTKLGTSNGGGEPATADDDHDDHAGHDHAPAATNPFVGLQYGSLGSDVKSLQSTLMQAGIHVRGGADGVFGFATRDAVRDFQRKNGLEVTGKVDELTAVALASGAPAKSGSALVGLKAGSLGNTVKQLQQAMIDAGITVRGGADGIFGPATANALKEFQTSQGLEATGVVNEKTAAALASPQPVAAKQPEASADPAKELGFPEFGEKSDRVKALQSALIQAGISVRGGVDGQFGGGTSAAVMEFQRQNNLSVTGAVSTKTAELLGLAAAEEPATPDPATVEISVFPVQGRCFYSDTWLYPRSGGRKHLGVDIIATEGKLLYAVADGKITKVYEDYPGSLAGNGVRLTMADGTYFFYAHMTEVAEGIELGVPVKAGQVVGYLGNTGNSGTAHLHFEVHPKGGSAVNPYPIVKAIDGCSNTEPLPQP